MVDLNKTKKRKMKERITNINCTNKRISQLIIWHNGQKHLIIVCFTWQHMTMKKKNISFQNIASIVITIALTDKL